MKHLLIIILSCSLAITSIAQDNEFTPKWAIKGGYNYTTAKVTYNDVKQKVTAKHGVNVAAMLKIPFEGALHFSPYVGYSLKGFTVSPTSGATKREEFTIHYIEIAPVLSVDIPIVENKVVLSAGPFLGITNMGKLKITNTNNTVTSGKMEFGFGGYGWFDLGFATGIAMHYNKFFIEASYTNSLTNINNNEEFDFKVLKNRTLSLNIGYYLK